MVLCSGPLGSRCLHLIFVFRSTQNLRLHKNLVLATAVDHITHSELISPGGEQFLCKTCARKEVIRKVTYRSSEHDSDITMEHHVISSNYPLHSAWLRPSIAPRMCLDVQQ